jgi:hypothetical protein
MLRCSKTLIKKYIGILYERYTKNPDDSTIIQGLVGRITGYDYNGISIIYTNIKSIIKYEELWNSNFEDKNIKWNSKTTTYRNGKTLGKNTFNDPNHYNIKNNDDNDDDNKPKFKIFDSFEELQKYFNYEFKNNNSQYNFIGPRINKKNKNGFYEATIRSVKKVYSCNEIQKYYKFGLNLNSSNNLYRHYPCYENINDEKTLKWYFIYYDKN